jgi:chromosomal replication initiation ATPase DnaA
MRHFLVTYTRRLNRRNGRSGHVFQGRFKSLLVEEVVHQSILGTQSFVKWVKKKLPRNQQREIPSLGKLQHDISAEHIIEEVARADQVQTEDLLDRKTRLKELRQMAMELSYRYSNGKQAEIGAVFGVDYSTVSQSRARMKAKLKRQGHSAPAFGCKGL